MESLIEDVEKVLYNIYAYRGINSIWIGGMNMYKEYMLKCECWNPLDGIWGRKC